MNPKVDWYFNKAEKSATGKPQLSSEGRWQEEIRKLRTIVLETGLIEELKWGVPCYSLYASAGTKKSNIVLIHVFKEYCALLFFKGALLNDENGILVQQTKNVQSARQIRFTNLKEIEKLKPVIKAYIYEAIEVEKAGLKVNFKKEPEQIPEEFKSKLDKMPALKKAFYSLTPGRQRAYILYFSAAKQSKTRDSRVEKYVKQILKGKGLDD